MLIPLLHLLHLAPALAQYPAATGPSSNLRLNPPPPPQPPTTALDLVIPADPNAAGFPLSIPQKGNFLGFSIELSVATTLLGDSPTNLKPTFLNYLANIQIRIGEGALIRVGGNTQDSSTLFVDGLPGGASVSKISSLAEEDGTTQALTTPVINYSLDLLYTMTNITKLVGTEWYFGLAFNQTDVDNVSPNIAVAAEWSKRILGDSLKGLALGNEPDLYARHADRAPTWGMADYVNEFGHVREEINKQVPADNLILGPSVCCNVEGFEFGDVLSSGWLEQNINYLAAVTVQHYPNNNCQINGAVRDPQALFPDFLNHTSAQMLTDPYLAGSATAQAAGKEILMLEMNTASCGGFPGISDSFGAAMWTADWALQLARGNFSAALMHVGGQAVYYNPFTPPPHTTPRAQWTTGSIYYSTLLIAEAFGSSKNARVIDLLPSAADMYHPVYVIYENDQPARAVLFNYVTDASGGSDYTATISSQSSSVSVRYLRASSTAEQWAITWAGQTMGGPSGSDGRLTGEVETVVVPCNEGKCAVHVPGPSIALVFFTDEALKASSPQANIQPTYATTVVGKGGATLPYGAVQTGNGFVPKLGGSSAAHNAPLHIGVGIVAVALAIGVAAGVGV